jgi:hypothetical protein
MPFALDGFVHIQQFCLNFITNIGLIQSSHGDVLSARRTLENISSIQLDRDMTIENIILLLCEHLLLLFRPEIMPSCRTRVNALGAGKIGCGERAKEGPLMNWINSRDLSQNVDGYMNTTCMQK